MKTKVLFVVSDFYHGGAQREMYEIDCALNKTNLEVYILCLHSLNRSDYFSDFFYEKHIKLATRVVFLKDLINLEKKSIFKKLYDKFGFTKKPEDNKIDILTNFLKNHEQVFFMGEYTYKNLVRYISSKYNKRKNIFIMCARFQGEHYRDLNKNDKYNFISAFDTLDQIEFEFDGFSDYDHIFFPLSMSIDKSWNKWTFGNDEIKKIAIFTRLSKAKPLDPFFYTFHLLLSETENLELHIFGAGDYKEAEYDKYINHLGLESKVFFRGHQQDIKTTLNKEHIDLVWFQGYLNRPAGYAGQDVILSGTPILLWDFYTGENKNINKLEYVFPHFKNLGLFAAASKSILLNKEAAEEVALKQYNEILNTRDVEKNIVKINKLFN